jgi:hypothetical protein
MRCRKRKRGRAPPVLNNTPHRIRVRSGDLAGRPFDKCDKLTLVNYTNLIVNIKPKLSQKTAKNATTQYPLGIRPTRAGTFGFDFSIRKISHVNKS